MPQYLRCALFLIAVQSWTMDITFADEGESPRLVDGDQDSIPFTIEGDVPEPGIANVEKGKASFKEALQSAGVELEGDLGSALRITIYRDREMVTIYPSKHGKELADQSVEPFDIIIVFDSRRYPEKVREAEERLAQALDLRSTGIAQAIWKIASLRYQYGKWEAATKEKEAGSYRAHLRTEVERLRESEHRGEVIAMIERYRDSLIVEGFGKRHPLFVKTVELLALMKDDALLPIENDMDTAVEESPRFRIRGLIDH